MKKLILSLLAFSALSASAQVPTTGLVEHFTFDNMLTGINGTLLNGVSNLQDDRNGNNTSAFQLASAVNVCVDFAIANFPTAVNSSKSVAFWFKHETNTIHSFFNYNLGGSGTPVNSFYVSYEDGNLLFGSVTAGSFAFHYTAMPYSVDWTHVALTFDGTEMKAYINGTLASTVTISVPVLDNGLANIGASPADAAYYDFTIDELLIYDRALTGTEVSNIYGTDNNLSINVLGLDNFEIYPNPTNGLVNISNIPAGIAIKVSDASGRVIATQISEVNTTSFDFSNQENGVYFISFQNTVGASVTKKLIISK